MNRQIQTASIAERFDHLLSIIGSQRFLDREGIGNEVPFFIAPFRVAETNEMEKLRRQLVKKLKQSSPSVNVLDINLFDLVREMLNNESDDWTWCLDNEPRYSKAEWLEHLRGIAGTQQVVEGISRKMHTSEFDVLFLSGIGEVFPFIRSHNILNSLQKEAKTEPTVMFFPGEYTHSLEKGASLDLFGRLHDDKYYRAFNIFDREN